MQRDQEEGGRCALERVGAAGRLAWWARLGARFRRGHFVRGRSGGLRFSRATVGPRTTRRLAPGRPRGMRDSHNRESRSSVAPWAGRASAGGSGCGRSAIPVGCARRAGGGGGDCGLARGGRRCAAASGPGRIPPAREPIPRRAMPCAPVPAPWNVGADRLTIFTRMNLMHVRFLDAVLVQPLRGLSEEVALGYEPVFARRGWLATQ